MLSGSIAHYRILHPLGQGGMGEVYLAEDTKLGRRVAIKTLPEARQQDAVARQRLLREARAAAALNQPNICTIHEVGEHDGLSFVVMEFVEGETLRDTLSHGRLDRSEALRIMSGCGRCTRGGAPVRHRSSRSEAGQHHAYPHGEREGDGFRPRPAGRARWQTLRRESNRNGIDDRGHDARHADLHGARAVARRPCRHPLRSVRVRHRAV